MRYRGPFPVEDALKYSWLAFLPNEVNEKFLGAQGSSLRVPVGVLQTVLLQHPLCGISGGVWKAGCFLTSVSFGSRRVGKPTMTSGMRNTLVLGTTGI
jgi:hypothetical protein